MALCIPAKILRFVGIGLAAFIFLLCFIDAIIVNTDNYCYPKRIYKDEDGDKHTFNGICIDFWMLIRVISAIIAIVCAALNIVFAMGKLLASHPKRLTIKMIICIVGGALEAYILVSCIINLIHYSSGIYGKINKLAKNDSFVQTLWYIIPIPSIATAACFFLDAFLANADP